MIQKQHLLVLDPIAFAGGSKIATENILRCVDTDRVRITVVTRDPASWRWSGLKRSPLFEFRSLAGCEQGLGYFLRHIIIVLSLIWARLLHGRIDIALGASGPGVDLALYLARSIMAFDIVQLVHGPVARSRTIGRCLRSAGAVFFLQSARQTVQDALETVMPSEEADRLMSMPHFHVMTNGLPKHHWPTASHANKPVIFWAASLLKWKGLDLLLEALKMMEADERPSTHICYIQPESTSLPVSKAKVPMERVHWHESPWNLDSIRASSSIFVSTSQNEPFGLSVLEAMAAGHCVLIPADGAYWDRVLKDNVNCIKYRPEDPVDLYMKLQAVAGNMPQARIIGEMARRQAGFYSAEQVYAPIVQRLERPVDPYASYLSAQLAGGE